MIRDVLAVGFVTAGCVFFLAGTVGMLRFPNTVTRLHALTKADTLGLGMVAIGVAVHAGSPYRAAVLGLIWFLVIVASSTVAYLIAGRSRRWTGGRE